MAVNNLPQKREHEHLAPSPGAGIRFMTREQPVRMKWVAKAAFALILFVVGGVVNVIAGAMIGFSMDIGPDETGGTIYLVFGSLAILILGVPLRLSVTRASRKRANGMIAWYAFTGTAYLFAIVLGFSMILYFCKILGSSVTPKPPPFSQTANTSPD